MIKIIDYKAGNAPSVMHAVNSLGFRAEFARCAEDLNAAQRIILPGVGSAKATMESLHELGLRTALEEAVVKKGIPFFGICVGMQILFEHSQEEDTVCLGWLKGQVLKFDSSRRRVPQMGWNKVFFRENSAVKDDYFYFVNSYYAKPCDENDIWGKADYGGAFTAAVKKGNINATQFHVEKSGAAGLELLKNFLNEGG